MPSTIDARNAKEIYSNEFLLYSGVSYNVWYEVIALAAAGVNTFSFSTGIYPVLLQSINVEKIGNEYIYIEPFQGGAVSGGGANSTLACRNQNNIKLSPYLANSIWGGRTIDTAGTQLDRISIDGARKDENILGAKGWVLLPNTLYYLSTTNGGTGAISLHVQIIAATLLP